METQTNKVSYSLPSLIAMGTALASMFTGALLGFVLAIVAIVCGVIGVLLSLSPNVRGGMISILSLVLAAIGIVIAVFRAFARVL